MQGGRQCGGSAGQLSQGGSWARAAVTWKLRVGAAHQVRLQWGRGITMQVSYWGCVTLLRFWGVTAGHRGPETWHWLKLPALPSQKVG